MLGDILFFIQVWPSYNIRQVSSAPFVHLGRERGFQDHYCTTALNNNKSKTKYGKELVPDGSAGHRHARQWEAHAQLSVGYRLLLCGVGMSCSVDQ